MGTKVHCESYLPGYYSMRDPNEGSSSSNWPLLYGDKTLGNGQFRNGYLVGTVSNSCSGGDMDAFRQKMLEHDAVFRHQVVELHRLYQIQKDMMEKSKRKELHNHRTPMETSSSSSPFVSRMHSEDAWKLQKSNIPYLHSKPAVEVLNSNTELRINSPPWSSARGNINQADQFLSQNGCSSNDCEILEVRPSKVRKKLFDLQLPGDAYIDPDNKISDISSRSHIKCLDMNTGSKLKVEHNGDTYMSSSCFRNPTGLADLNEPVQVEEPIHLTQVDSSKSSNFLLGLPREVFNTPQYRSANGISDYLHVNNKGDERGRLSYTYQGHDKTNQSFIPQGAQQDFSLVSHKPMDTTLDKFHHPQSVVESAQVTGDLWREREKPLHGLRIQETLGSSEVSTIDEINPRKKPAKVVFGEEMLVEVSSDEDGFQGAWFAATIIKRIRDNGYLIEYKSLRNDDDTDFLREEADALHIRPYPPDTIMVDRFNLYEEVDALYQDGWWVGVISKVLNDGRYAVYFRGTDEEMKFDQSELRIHHEWINGKWFVSPRALKW